MMRAIVFLMCLSLAGLIPSTAFAQQGKAADLVDGMKVRLEGTEGIVDYTRLWIIGDSGNITRIYFVIHGDKIVDYSDDTAQDRREMADALPPGEGAVVAYPISAGDRSWPAFTGGALQVQNGPVLIRMFKQLAARAGNDKAIFEQFALSGGGKVNMALMVTILAKYDSDQEVRSFVDDNLRGIHDGAALCYDMTPMVNAYFLVLANHPLIRATFIHNTKPGEEVDYGYLYHYQVAEHLDHDLTPEQFPKGGSLSLQDGRIRFWSSPEHINTWKTQFARVFLSSVLPSD